MRGKLLQLRRRGPSRARQGTPEDFVRAWQTSSSIAEVCALLGLKKHTAYMRAERYRALGIPLKKFGGGPLDVDGLAALARSLEKP